MKTIDSNKLIEARPLFEPTDTLSFGDRLLPTDTSTIVQLTDEHSAKIEAMTLSGLQAFGALEHTLAVTRIGLPTLIARVDCTIDTETGSIHPYEVEDRPAGIGVTDMMAERLGVPFGKLVLGHFEDLLGVAPVVKVHPNVQDNDDANIFRVERFTPTRLKTTAGQPILVRASPIDMRSHPHLDNARAVSVAPITEEGKREYRIRTGHANVITHSADLPEGSFVLKTMQGSQATGVKIHVSKEDAKVHDTRDAVTRGMAESFVNTNGAVLLERFVPGIPCRIPGAKIGHGILRIFSLVGPNSARVIGGAYMARPGHLVHGSKDAVMGLVIGGPHHES